MGRKKKEEEQAVVLRADVYESNPLIQARKEFNVMGMRIFLLGLRTINPHFSENDKEYDEKFKEVVIPPSQLVEIFGGNTNCLHTMKAECKKLFNTIVEFDKASGGYTFLHLFRVLKYEPREGLHLQFEELLRPYLLDLLESKGFTKIDVEQIFFLTSTYAMRLVELMLQYQNLPTMKISRKIVRRFALEDLKFALNVPQNAYDGRFDNFCKKVVASPVEEINAKTIYRMTYEVKREGHTPKSVEFTMDLSAVPPEDVRPRFAEEAINKLLSLKFSQKAAQKILSKCNGVEDCLRRIDNAQKILRRQKRRGSSPVENEVGFLREAILENWEPSAFTKPRSSTPPTPKPTRREVLNSNAQRKKAVFPQAVPPLKAKITPENAQMLHDYLASGLEGRKFVESALKSIGWTLNEFLATDFSENKKEAPVKELLPEQVEFLHICLNEGIAGQETAEELLKGAGLTLEDFYEKYRF